MKVSRSLLRSSPSRGRTPRRGTAWPRWWGQGTTGRLFQPEAHQPRMPDAQCEQLQPALIEGPLAWGYENELWTLPRVTEVIREVTGIDYHPGHVWRQ